MSSRTRIDAVFGTLPLCVRDIGFIQRLKPQVFSLNPYKYSQIWGVIVIERSLLFPFAMKIFVTGATGVLGSKLVDELTDRDHTVVGLARDDEGEQTIRERDGIPHRGDVFDRESLVAGADGADGVVHAATCLPTKTKTTEEDWRQNDRVRVDGGKNAIEAAATVGASRFLTHSVVWAYRNADGSKFDETATPNTDRTTESAVDVERLVRRASDDYGIDASILRFGWFYGPASGQTEQIAKNLLSGDLPIIGRGFLGRGDTVISCIHSRDAARAMADAVEAEASGTWHVVDDKPVRTADFFSEFATRLQADDPRRVPRWLARFVAGSDMVRFLTSSFPTSNERFKAEVGWEPEFSTYRDGVAATVQTWLDDGTLVVGSDGYRWGSEVSTRYECRSCGRQFEANTRTCPHCQTPNHRPVSTS